MKIKFDGLIELIEPLKKDEYRRWIVDTEHKGTEDDSIHFPYPCYTAVVDELISQVYAFSEGNPDYELTNYGKLLEERGLEWGSIKEKLTSNKVLAEVIESLNRRKDNGDLTNNGIIRRVEGYFTEFWF